MKTKFLSVCVALVASLVIFDIAAFAAAPAGQLIRPNPNYVPPPYGLSEGEFAKKFGFVTGLLPSGQVNGKTYMVFMCPEEQSGNVDSVKRCLAEMRHKYRLPSAKEAAEFDAAFFKN